MEGASLGRAALVVFGMFVPYIFSGLAQRRLYDKPLPPSPRRCSGASVSSPAAPPPPSLAASDDLSYAAPREAEGDQGAPGDGCMLLLSPAAHQKDESFRFTFTVLAMNCATSAVVAFLALLLVHLWDWNGGRAGGQREAEEGVHATDEKASETEGNRERIWAEDNEEPAGGSIRKGESERAPRDAFRGFQMAILSRAAWRQAVQEVGTLCRRYLCFSLSSLPTSEGARRVAARLHQSRRGEPEAHPVTPHFFLRKDGAPDHAASRFSLASLVSPWKTLSRLVSCWHPRAFSLYSLRSAGLGRRSRPPPRCLGQGRDEQGEGEGESETELEGVDGVKGEALSSCVWPPNWKPRREGDAAMGAFPSPSPLVKQRDVGVASQRYRTSRLFPPTDNGQGKEDIAAGQDSSIRRELLLVSFCTFAAKAASFHSLIVIDFATLAVAKCAKPVGVLVLSALLGRRVRRRELVSVLWLAVWVYVFNASSASEKRKDGGARASASVFDADLGERILGNLVLLISLVLDSFSVSRQDQVLLQRHRLCPYTLMLASSVYGLLFSLLLCFWFEGASGFRFFLASVVAASGASGPASPAFLSPTRRFTAGFQHLPSAPAGESPVANLAWAAGEARDGRARAGVSFLSLVSLSPFACGIVVAVGSAVSQLCGSQCMRLVGAVSTSILSTLRRVALVFVALLLQREPVPWLAGVAVTNICVVADELSSPCSLRSVYPASPLPLFASASCLQESGRCWAEGAQTCSEASPTLSVFVATGEAGLRQGFTGDDSPRGLSSFASRLPSLSSPASTCEDGKQGSPTLGGTMSTAAHSDDGDEKGKRSA
ncbi:conserved hypothetical protein [Neospora caninum Liverpool]|uniref:UAA transporter family protein n=1 Tax=Neospora caninum (strain Liverpool) TaxID=572307 RepID=F0VQW4_NEOCL|nr:conserved hypothetical protein [Neospora caninum Liverpool]CBZ56111.1 conserved hypothetical protein [Neospora caninum Liverpool]|eukprot:XP_003886137.1 conserved hypothetical protein [Neospora caninum Liverpool]